MTESRRGKCPVDFDHRSQEFKERPLAYLKEARDCPEMPFNAHYDGFWMATRYADVKAAARDADTFTNRYEPEPVDGIDFQGSPGIPRNPASVRLGMGESIGEYHLALRRAFMPYFSPPTVARLQPFWQRLSNWFMDQHIENGGMDFVNDFASPVPSIATMRICGLPPDHWQRYANYFQSVNSFPPESEKFQRALPLRPLIRQQLLEHAAQKRVEPGDDLTTAIVKFRFGDETLDDDAVVSLLFNFISGGVGTTAALTSLVLRHLARDRAAREQLRSNRKLMPSAVEEFLRYFSSVHMLARTVTRDTRLGGSELGRGDRVYMGFLSANRDERQFDHPDEVRLDRSPNHHLAFGLGPHRCIGAHLARVLIRTVLETVLDRIPDYEVDEKATRQFWGATTWGLENLPIRFTPGPRLEAAEPPF